MQKMIGTKAVCEKLEVGRDKLIAMCKAEEFPPPVRLHGKNMWLELEVDLMIKSMISGMSKEGLRDTVQEIKNRRFFHKETYDVTA